MMNNLRLYDLVRVRQLLQDADSYDGWHVNRRPPQVGDIGTFIDLLHAPGLPDHYIVESSDSDGVTIWLGEFLAEELEPVSETDV